MKILYFPFLLFTFLSISIKAQVLTTGNWIGVGDVDLSIVTDDLNNGDGVGDGAIYVNGQSGVVGQGITHTFDGTMTLNESISIDTYTYNRNVSFVGFVIDLYNETDNTVLATSPTITISNSSSPPVQTLLSYTAQTSDVGDVLKIRYIRNDNGSTARNFVIDNLQLNGNFISIDLASSCPFTITPDLPLIASNPTIEAEISAAVARFSDDYLGTSAPSGPALASAESDYDDLNITVAGGEISGDAITDFRTLKFLKTFAQHLKFNPGDTNIKTKANNAVWLTGKYFCTGTLALNSQMYNYQDFARPTSLLQDFLDPDVQDLFAYTLYEHSVQFEHFWEASYDETYQEANGAINTDLIYNISDVMLAYSLWHDTADERYQYMLGYKRYIDRFFSHTVGTTDGIKADGSGFHHWTAYNNYMYSYNTAASLLSYLSGTSFQVDQANYKVFSEAFYSQYMQANDDGVQGFATAGRNPQSRKSTLSQSALKTLAIAGGDILGLSTADPILSGIYNRIYGVDSEFNYGTVAAFEEGFFQFNHASASIFRKDNWIVFNKGFSNNMWGGEIYNTQNRFGRYQSYGAQEVLYPGDRESGNGYDVETWDWNFNPGTTVIRLPWANLHAEKGRIDEMQQKRFVGAVNLNKKNSELLQNNHGDFGLFAMDFQELEGQGFSTVHSGENHNDTFTFKKSNFYFDDIIVCLGSGISNDDATNSTITTFYQRIDNTANGVNVNGTNQSSAGEVTFSGASNNWLLNNYNTGFYLFSGANSLKVNKAVQQTPNQNQIWPNNPTVSGNATETYYTGYIDHGTAPSNRSYEYILKPSSSVAEMQALHTTIQGGTKPYTVHQQDANAHIVEHEAKNVWGYSFFNSASALTYDHVNAVNGSCLVMTEYNSTAQTLLISLSNPDIGFESRSYASSVVATKQVTLQGEWHFVTTNPAVTIVSSNAVATIVEFITVDGLSYEVMLEEGPEVCATTSTFSDSGWDNGTPSATKKAIFTKDYDTGVDGDIDACACEVRAGTKVVVKAGDFMNVEGNVAVNGTLIVEHQGSVVQVDDTARAINNGTIQIEVSTPNLDTRDFIIMGSPLTLEDRSDVWNTAFLVLDHDTSNFIPNPEVAAAFPAAENFADDNYDAWTTYTGAINPAEGYIVRPQTGYTGPGGIFDFTYEAGTLNNGVHNFNVIYNTPGPTAAENKIASPNVVANPYASAISANAFISANAMVDEIYFWEHLTPPSPDLPGAGSMDFSMEDISMYNLMGGTAAASDPSGTITEPNGVIATAQGFAFKANNTGTAIFNNSMRLTTGNTTLRTPLDKDRIWIALTNETYDLQDVSLIGFSENSSPALDQGYDSKRLATVVSLYSHLEDGSYELGIQSREAFDPTIEIPMGFSTLLETDTEYTISIAKLEGALIENATVYLLDKQGQVLTNLSEENYSFGSYKGTFNERFTLMFESEPVLETNDLAVSNIIAYPNPANDILHVQSLSTTINEIKVYDLLGRILIQLNPNAPSSTIEVDLSTLNAAAYFIEVTTENGSIVKQIIKE